MDKIFESIKRELKEFETQHIKVDIGKKRRQFIKYCYQNLKMEEDSLIGVHYDRKSVTIRIVSKGLISCSESPALLYLIGISDVVLISKCRYGFIIDIDFNLWRWKKKKEATK